MKMQPKPLVVFVVRVKPTRNWGVLALLLTASVSLAGCATKLQPTTSARISPDIADPVRAGSLLLAARIVPDERPIELHGELSAKGRAAFEEARSARIAARPSAGRDLTGSDIAECLIKGFVVLCPLTLAVRGAALGTINGVRYIKASAREASMLIPENHADRLAAMFKEGATGRALGERASRFTMPVRSTDGADAEPQIVVRMKTVETFESHRNWLGIRVIAEAQAIPTTGIAPAPTEHVYVWTYGPLSAWTEQGDELVRQMLNEALDMLAGSIASTYMGSWESPNFAPFGSLSL